ncbi:unnamed protein product, partial [Rotaria magnacalcarata]
MQQPLFNE